MNTGALSITACNDLADVTDTFEHPVTRHIQAVGYLEDRLTWTVLDESIRRDFTAIERQLGRSFRVLSRDRLDETWVVSGYSDTAPPSHWLYTRNKNTLSALPDLTDGSLAGYQLSSMASVQFAARDGLTISAYVTLPVVARTPVPFVLLLHGGPWQRDEWGFDSEVQWLANRGFGVMQVNFRGSAGYGKDFLRAGNREWAGRMLTDIVDAKRWAVENSLAIESQVAVFGGSYGGYASLMSLAMHGDDFAAAVAIAPPTDLVKMVREFPPSWAQFRSIFDKRVGDIDKDEAFLRQISPIAHVASILKPVLIAQGANDPRVSESDTDVFAKALSQYNRNTVYLQLSADGHRLNGLVNRLEVYRTAEAFLTEHVVAKDILSKSTNLGKDPRPMRVTTCASGQGSPSTSHLSSGG